ncbi:Uncharacterised protein [Mycobacteroides abscessus subsp. abscessus]|nr:Uncharacterised protein [Mycobacteroides abscessus subsp. abscessus]
MRDHQNSCATVFSDDPVARTPHSVVHRIEALPFRRSYRGVAEPLAMQLGVALGCLGEGQAFPLTEVGLDQIVVDRQRHSQRTGRGRGSLLGTAQRRADHCRDAAPAGQIARGLCRLLAPQFG